VTQKIRVITSFGGWFDMDKPPDFSLPTYIQHIRAAGYMLNETMYVPHDQLVSVFVFDTDNMPQVPQGVPMPPHGGTLQ
jgi:hypothetical protein